MAGSSSSPPSLVFWSMGVLFDLYKVVFVSYKRSTRYFCCQMKIPLLEWATSIPSTFASPML